jgi:hypothetical protein
MLHLMEDETLKLAEESEAGGAAFVAIVDKLKEEYLDFTRNGGGAAKEFRCIDRIQTVYCLSHFSLLSLFLFGSRSDSGFVACGPVTETLHTLTP